MSKMFISLSVLVACLGLTLTHAVYATEKTEEGYLGVFLQPVPELLAVHLGLSSGVGVVAADVAAESPADKAGLKQHDVIVSMGDKEVTGQREFAESVRAAGAGAKIKLGLISKGQKKEIEVVLGSLSEAQGAKETKDKPGRRLLQDDDRLLQPFGRGAPGVRPIPRIEPLPSLPEDIRPLIDPEANAEKWQALEDRIAAIEKQQAEILEKLDKLLSR